MGDKSNIEWTDASWNPIVGCSLESPGCTNCYAMRQARRVQGMMRAQGKASHYDGTTKVVKGKPVWTGLMRQAPEHILLQPLRWTTPRMIFVNSMSDLFHPDVPDAWIDQVFAVMALTPQHTYQVLTKRAERMRAYVGKVSDEWCAAREDSAPNLIRTHMCRLKGVSLSDYLTGLTQWPLPNVWLGVSAEDQKRYDERKEHLRHTPAAVHFFSFEPLLGAIRGDYFGEWAIAGGESGPNARPMHPDWARSLRDQCATARVPFFFKQWGEHIPWERKGEWEWTAQNGQSAGYPPNTYGGETVITQRVGKSRAGRLLDGREHNDMPERANG